MLNSLESNLRRPEPMPWYLREHASHVTGRYFSAGWEHETVGAAREYVSHQYRIYKPADLENTPFTFSVKSNGVHVYGVIFSDSNCYVRSHTYTKQDGETMRDTVRGANLTDCVWLVPGYED